VNRSTVGVIFGGTSSQARASGSSKPSPIGRTAGSPPVPGDSEFISPLSDRWEPEAVRADKLLKESQMPKKEIVRVNLAAANPNLSPATRFGNLVFVAGQTGRHPITGEVGRDVDEQTRYAIERIKTILESAGTSLDNVLTVLTHLTKREDLAAYNEEYAKFFPTDKPARTTVEAMLNFPELLVEITVTACIPE
jgi:2-iminobutanoate/2-iminopropanoate deaminase